MPLDAGPPSELGSALPAPTTSSRRCADVSTSPRPRAAQLGAGPALARGRRTGDRGIIASVSDAFCLACDRTRLTARRAGTQLPFAAAVETDLVQPDAPGRRRRRTQAAVGHGAKAPGTASTAPLPLQLTRPMSAPGGCDRSHRHLGPTSRPHPGHRSVSLLRPATPAGTETSVLRVVRRSTVDDAVCELWSQDKLQLVLRKRFASRTMGRVRDGATVLRAHQILDVLPRLRADNRFFRHITNDPNAANGLISSPRRPRPTLARLEFL